MKPVILLIAARIMLLPQVGWTEDLLIPTSGDPRIASVTLVVQWTPQSQFAGYYVALSKGIYRQKGLDVRILRGGPQVDSGKLLHDGRATFGTFFLTGAIAARDQGIPLVNISQIVNHSNLMVVAWKDHNILHVTDLYDRRLSIWEGPFRGAFLGMFLSLGIKPIIVPQNYSVNLFLRRGIDACCAMYYNEYHMIYQAGVDLDQLSIFLLRDHGFDIPEDGIYCLETTLREKPEVCRSFAEASLEGWLYARDHQGEALDIVMEEVQKAHLPTNRMHMKWMLEKILPTIIPSHGENWLPGHLSEEGYRRGLEAMKAQIKLAEAPNLVEFCGGRIRAQ